MSKPFTFGVELEMMVALVRDEVEGQRKPNPSETRIVVFPSTNEPEDLSNNTRKSKQQFPALFYANRVHAEFRRIIDEAGFPVASSGSDISAWAVVSDTSLRHPAVRDPDIDLEGYDWIGIEVKTPALPFTPESLQAVRDVCSLIKTHFKALTNATTGFMFTSGMAISGSTSMTLLRSWRSSISSRLSSLHFTHTIVGVIPMAGAFAVLVTSVLNSSKCMLRYKLADIVHTTFNGKNGNYNFNGIKDVGLKAERPTIEFRQHDGTMDSERIVQWVQLLVGTLKYIENEDYSAYVRFLSTIADQEKWEKTGDGKDGEREAEKGPTLADDEFPIIDLLHYIGLSEQAAYFNDKVYKHDIPPQKRCVQTRYTSGVDWKYERGPAGANRESDEYKRADKLRHIYEDMRVARLASRIGDGKWNFDEDAPLWPAHLKNLEFVEESEGEM
ncbi:uncharacterized protein RCO7_02571 [Rhynchosporium graminicola]|uniref:Uncharacterized protein n=1 Tax=Rhynchosporium graminicola TaxID=2792576 RepID=A0A1E1KIT4_9HELO|nr:uncharacterized protein RCO7_02571 [Rhynchosporium commune]